MGAKLSQPQDWQQQRKLGQWAGAMNQPTEKDPVTLPESQVNQPSIPQIFGGDKQSKIPSVFV